IAGNTISPCVNRLEGFGLPGVEVEKVLFQEIRPAELSTPAFFVVHVLDVPSKGGCAALEECAFHGGSIEGVSGTSKELVADLVIAIKEKVGIGARIFHHFLRKGSAFVSHVICRMQQ